MDGSALPHGELDRIVACFLREGLVTIDTPLSPSAIAAGAAAIDRRLPAPAPAASANFRFGETCSFYDAELIDLIQHPFFESVAAAVLDTPEPQLFQTAITNVYPQPGAAWGYEQHVDVHYRQADWDSAPRRIICSFFLWLSDVNERRAPMMCRPGSHLLLARPGRRGHPHVAGVGLDQLPALPYAPPIPALARAGQVSVATTAMIHGSSTNVDDAPRRALVMTYTAPRVRVDLPFTQDEERRAYRRRLARLLRPERVHIVAGR